MVNLRIPALCLVLATGALCAQDPVKPPPKVDAIAEKNALLVPYQAAVESANVECDKRFVTLQNWYLAGLDKLQNDVAKTGDLNGAVAVKAERDRIAVRATTTPEQVKAMAAPLRKLRAAYEPALKKIKDEAQRRMDEAQNNYLTSLEALQKRATVSGEIDQALLVRAEKERFIAQAAANKASAVTAQPAMPPATAVKPPPSAPATAARAGIANEETSKKQEMEAISKLLRQGEWFWYDGNREDLPLATFKFLDKGKITTSARFWHGWEPLDANRFKVFHRSGRYWIFEFDAEKKEARTTKEQGSLAEDKILRAC